MNLKREFARSTEVDWDHAMIMWFAIVSELFDRKESIPSHWEYSPAKTDGKQAEDGCWYAELASEASSSELIRLGNILCRYTKIINRGAK